MKNALIELKQAPIIEFSSMESRGLEVKEQISQMNINQIEPIEENRAMMKKMRAGLNKELGVFEDQRKMIHGKITEPYNSFKSSYETNIKTVYQNANEQLKAKISEVENKMLEIKTTTLKAYFDDKNTFNFINFDSIGLNIILSATDKKLKSQVDSFINKLSSEVESINSMENSTRILGYYQKTLDLTDSITTVISDMKREKELKIERERKAKEDKERQEREAIEARELAELQAKQAEEQAVIDAQNAKVRLEQAEKNAALLKSEEAENAKKQAEHEAEQAIIKQEEAEKYQERLEQENIQRKAKEEADRKIHIARFEVKATMSKLKEIKQFFQDNEIEFKGIK